MSLFIAFVAGVAVTLIIEVLYLIAAFNEMQWYGDL